MAGRTIKSPPKLSALICALFEDDGRFFFLTRTDERGRVLIDLPSLLVNEGEDPVSMLSSYLRSSLSLDSQIHLISLRGIYNAGTRKRRNLITALAFSCSAKKMNVALPSPYSGFSWLSAEDALEKKLGRNTEWLRMAQKV